MSNGSEPAGPPPAPPLHPAEDDQALERMGLKPMEPEPEDHGVAGPPSTWNKGSLDDNPFRGPLKAMALAGSNGNGQHPPGDAGTALGGVQPPHSLELEREVLGAILVEPECLAVVRSIIEPSDFYFERHFIIYGVMTWLADNESPIDPVTIQQRLIGIQKYESVGGARSIGEILDRHGFCFNVGFYAKKLRAIGVQRNLFDAARSIEVAASSGLHADDTPDLIAKSTLVWQHALKRSVEPASTVTHAERVAAYVESVHSPVPDARMKTGIPRLDRDTGGGLKRTWLVVVQAAAKVGKSVLACNNFVSAVCNDMMNPGRALIASLEMGYDEHFQRWFARETAGHVPAIAQEKGDLSPGQWTLFNEAADRLSQWKVDVDTSARSLALIEASVKRFVEQHGGIDLLVVDGLTQVANPGFEGNRVMDIDHTTRGLKKLAVDYNCVVVLCVHVDKPSAKSGRPGLYDARGSSGPANDANLLLIPFKDDEDDSRAGLRIFGRSVKQGELALGTLRFDGATMSFVDMGD